LLGSAALWGGALVGVAAIILPEKWPRRLLAIAVGLASLACVTLAWALLTVDLSLAYVAETTSRATPWPYRLAAVWGGMDGSMLFYAAMTAVVVAVAFRRRGPTLAMRIASAVAGALLLFTAVFANPFVELDIPAVDGVGLLAILQHPAMIYHPPLLYLGLVTLVVPFALGVEDAVGSGRRRIREIRRWLLASWTLLTVGMVAGSSWAYIELGWGGFWAWDPVENTALMPWLAITCFIHVSRVTERDGRLGRWTTALATAPFALSVLGVYLTRSGVTGSIHAFAEDPVIGRILLGAALVVIVAVVTVALRSTPGRLWRQVGVRRSEWLAASTALVGTALVFVLVGSAYPAYARVFFGEEMGIDSTFFVSTVYPVALLITVGLALGLRTRWRYPGVVAGDWALLGVIAATVGVALALAGRGQSWPAIAGLGISVGAMVMLARDLAATRPRGRQLVAYVAHLGIALVIFGAAGSALGDEFSGTMRPGESVEVGGHSLALETITTGDAGRLLYARAVFLVDGSFRLYPEIRAYEDQAVPVSEPALRSTPGGDIIVATSLLFPEASAVEVNVFVRPLVWWVWLGSLLVAGSGLLALVGRDGGAGGRRPPAREERPRAGTARETSVR
jgi:cytochrome c-type biogenesis protein CcmF